MDMSDLITVEEAKEILGYKRESVALLCRQGKFEGVKRFGHQWFIPRKSVENYVKAPQGFAAIWKRKRETEEQSAAENVEKTEKSSAQHKKPAEKTASPEEKDVNREILKQLKILTEEIRNLEKIIAEGKN